MYDFSALEGAVHLSPSTMHHQAMRLHAPSSPKWTTKMAKARPKARSDEMAWGTADEFQLFCTNTRHQSEPSQTESPRLDATVTGSRPTSSQQAPASDDPSLALVARREDVSLPGVDETPHSISVEVDPSDAVDQTTQPVH